MPQAVSEDEYDIIALNFINLYFFTSSYVVCYFPIPNYCFVNIYFMYKECIYQSKSFSL